MHQIFTEQAEKTPERIALLYQDEQLTYGELNACSSYLANILRHKGVGPDQIVGLMIRRSFEVIIGILGILKAGGAYLPIDPQYPNERIEYLLKDSKAKILLTETTFIGRIRTLTHTANVDMDVEVFDLKEINWEVATKFKTSPVSDAKSSSGETVGANNLAYVIYTSGSTGQPKGVMVEHHSAVNDIMQLQKNFPITTDDTFLFCTTYTFDISVWDIFWWFFSGARLRILPQDGEKDPYLVGQLWKLC